MKKILVQIAFDPILYGAAGTQNPDFRYPFPHYCGYGGGKYG